MSPEARHHFRDSDEAPALSNSSAGDAGDIAPPGTDPSASLLAAERNARDETGSATVREPVLEAKGISKHFGHVTALDKVDLSLYAGEVCALVGDNGAGKTTLVSILTGLLQPDAGEIRLNGRRVRISSPARAHELGIATVFQDLALVGQRDVAANIFLGREPCRLGFIVNQRRMLREATKLIASLDVGLPSVHTRVSQLSGGQRQATAVARALFQKSLITLLDEPTAALGVREAARVLGLISKLHESGQAVLLVSHNMDSVFGLADRVVVLRHGRRLAERSVSETSRDEIVGLLVGARAADAQ